MNIQQKEIKSILENSDVVILDTETTGLEKDARIIELSIIDCSGKTLYTSLFDPGAPLPDKITEITGLTDADLKGKPSFSSEIAKIQNVLKDKIIAGWNIEFDIKRLDYEFGRLGLVLDNRYEDIMPLYCKGNNKELNRSGKYTCKLVKAKEEMNIGCNQEHRSLSDCLDTLAVMKAFVAYQPECQNLLDFSKEKYEGTFGFVNAVQKAMQGFEVTRGVQTNGEAEKLVVVLNSPFIRFKRPNSSNSYILQNPTTEDILSCEWTVTEAS